MTATTPNRATPTPQLRPLGYSGAVRITAGPWKDRIDDAVATYLAMPVDDVLHGYRLAAGQDAPGRPMDGWSSTTTQSTFGQWVSGLARIGVTAGVPAASARAVELVEGWAATLGPDDDPRMSLYGLEKLLCGLVDVALYADHPQSLRLVERLATWARHGLGTERKVASASDFAGGEHSVHEWYTFAENLHRAWLAGADDMVEEYACTFHYDTWWDLFRTAPAAGQAWDVPVWLHAYSHVNTFASAAAAFEATGEPGYLDILRNAPTWVTTTQTFATGGYGPGELTVPADGTLGGSLEWRTDSAEIVCGTWAAFKLSNALLRHTGDARYGDWVEVVPVAPKVFANPPVLTMVATYSGFMMALLLPSRQAGDLVAGMWQLLAGLGGVPKMLVWDNEPGIGQHRRLTLSARSFAGTLGTRIYQAAPRDPETKGVIERANGFFETSFMPGRTFTSPGDYNTQLAEWLPRANARMLRRTGQRPGVLIDEDVAAMGALPPVAPIAGATSRVRLARDYYVRVAGNDYSVDPTMIGRFVDVHTGLGEVVVTCAGTQVAAHVRSWSTHQTITDPDHVTMAAELRTAFQARTAAIRGPVPAPGTAVGQRALSHYDEVFNLSAAPPFPAAAPTLQVVR